MVLNGELLNEVYDELHRLASSFLRNERPNHTLQPSALINEAYIRLVTHRTHTAVDRPHFLRLAARAMRHVLIDHGRRHRAAKRDAALLLITDSNAAPAAAEPEDYLTIHDALTKLESVDPQLANVVELRFFGGLSVEETAEVMGVSETTVKREWAVARAWLRSELESPSPAVE
jgi:RNA polymerase sigma factor (TIGR02999 family)